MALNWGIAGSGKICHDFVSALGSEPKHEHQIVAVGARKIEDAKRFADLHKINKAHGSYEELAKDKQVQVVYIGTINTKHLPVAKLMLEHGKHVLIEKSLAINSNQVNQLINLAKKNNLFLMEALWSRFLPSHQFVKQQISNGVIGDVKHVFTNFGVLVGGPNRIATKSLGAGTMLDIGCYCLSLIEDVYEGEKPEKIVAVGHLNNEGVDENVTASFLFKNGKTASMSANSKVKYPNDAVIVGQKGTIEMESFWAASTVYVNDVKYEFSFPETVHPENFTNSSGLRYQAKQVRKCIKEGKIQSEIMSHEDSLLLASICDQIRKQIGVHYYEDD